MYKWLKKIYNREAWLASLVDSNQLQHGEYRGSLQVNQKFQLQRKEWLEKAS